MTSASWSLIIPLITLCLYTPSGQGQPLCRNCGTDCSGRETCPNCSMQGNDGASGGQPESQSMNITHYLLTNTLQQACRADSEYEEIKSILTNHQARVVGVDYLLSIYQNAGQTGFFLTTPSSPLPGQPALQTQTLSIFSNGLEIAREIEIAGLGYNAAQVHLGRNGYQIRPFQYLTEDMREIEKVIIRSHLSSNHTILIISSDRETQQNLNLLIIRQLPLLPGRELHVALYLPRKNEYFTLAISKFIDFIDSLCCCINLGKAINPSIRNVFSSSNQ